MSIGLDRACSLSLVLGIVLGGISGYYGGAVDHGIQRIIELPALDPDHSTLAWPRRGHAVELAAASHLFLHHVILSLIGWTSLARVVRGRFLSLRNEDFVTAARLDGVSEIGIIFRHMAPSFLSHIIAEVSLPSRR